MKKSRFTDEQIIGFLRQAAAGMPVNDCGVLARINFPPRSISISECSCKFFDQQLIGIHVYCCLKIRGKLFGSTQQHTHWNSI